MAIRVVEQFEGTNGTSLTTGNSTATGFIGTAPVFDTSVFKAGSSSGRFTTTGAASTMEKLTTSAGSGFFSFYVRPTAAPSGNTTLMMLGTAAGTANAACYVGYTTAMAARIQNQTGAIGSSTVTSDLIVLNQWNRFDVTFNAGNITLAIYPGDANCDNPVGSAPAGSTRTQTSTVTSYAYRSLGIGSAVTHTLYIDAFREDDTALPGPVAALPSPVASYGLSARVNASASVGATTLVQASGTTSGVTITETGTGTKIYDIVLPDDTARTFTLTATSGTTASKTILFGGASNGGPLVRVAGVYV